MTMNTPSPFHLPVRPEPVEGFFGLLGTGFDKLSPNGMTPAAI